MRQTNSCARLTSRKTRSSNAPGELGQEIELRFDDLLSNGQAVGRAGGMAVFVFGPLPSERAKIRITAVKPKYAIGEVVTLLETSQSRAEPFCPVFGICGGCQVQHLHYEAQLAWKRNVVRSALQRIGGISEADVKPVIGTAHPREYRNKMALVVDHPNHATGFGFYKQRSHDVVPIDRCPIVQPALNRTIENLIALRRDPKTSPAFETAKHVVARTSLATKQNVIALTTRQPAESLEALSETLYRRLPATAGLIESFDLPSENAILGRRSKSLAGNDSIEEIVGGLRFRISTRSFFQVNVEILERIFEVIAPLAENARKVFDLYCGSGAFALWFAKFGCAVFGIEENASAIEEARKNAGLNDVASRIEFQRGRVEDVLAQPTVKERLQAADAVFLDPPRKGTDPRVLEAIAAAGVGSVWYLSCDPATLARDLKLLLPKGYRLVSVQPFDMFPQTGHVESLAVLSQVKK